MVFWLVVRAADVLQQESAGEQSEWQIFGIGRSARIWIRDLYTWFVPDTRVRRVASPRAGPVLRPTCPPMD